MPTRPDTAALEALVGAWTMEAAFPGQGPSGVTGRTEFTWAAGGAFLLQRSEIDHPDAPDVVAVIGPDPHTGELVQHYFDSRGVIRRYATSLARGEWRLWREAPPPDFSQRYIGRLSEDGGRIDGAWEAADPTGALRHDFILNYIRIV